MKKVLLLHRLYREPWGKQALNFCPYWKLGRVSWNILWDMEKSPFVSSSRDLKRAWKCKPSVRKCKPSVTWVSKKFDIRALRDAACHIHLTGLWTLKARRVQPGPAGSSRLPWGCAAPYLCLLARCWAVTQLSWRGQGRGWTEFSSLLGRRQPAFQSGDELGWRPDPQPYRSSLGGH